MTKYVILSLAVLFMEGCPFSAVANDMPVDSVQRYDYHSRERFNPQKIIAPLALMTVGTLGVWTRPLKELNTEVKDSFDRLRGDRRIRCDNWLQYVPAVLYATLGECRSIKHNDTFAERLMAGGTAYCVMSLITNIAKHTVREPRPDTGSRNSFPSGHTATAFTGAELMRLEYGNAVGIAGYGVALSVAFLRLYNERHWLNDVIAGMGVGVLSANIGYWLLPYERRLFNYNSKDEKVAVSMFPAYCVSEKSPMITFNILF